MTVGTCRTSHMDDADDMTMVQCGTKIRDHVDDDDGGGGGNALVARDEATVP